jgi:lipoprotein-anchoring transpeptidase ErfK/SrfK
MRDHRFIASGLRVRATRGIVLTAAVSAFVALSTSAASAPAAEGARLAVAPDQKLVVLLSSHTARSEPDESSTSLGSVRDRRPITEERTVLPLVGNGVGPDGATWLRVLLPGRPNGHTGWILQRATRAALTSWRLVVHTASRRVSVYRYGRPVRVFKAVVGKPSTPTPPGAAFVEELIQLRASAVGAPFALALSSRSAVLQEFAGGPGQIALHGLTNVGGTLGTATSHGCVRLSNAAMRWLVFRVTPGTPVTVTR